MSFGVVRMKMHHVRIDVDKLTAVTKTINGSFKKCIWFILGVIFEFQPVLSTTHAHVISLAFGVTYVGSLYLSKNARLSFDEGSSHGENRRQRGKNERLRDDPDVIRARMVAVAFATAACCLGIFFVLWVHMGETEDFNRILKSTLLRLGVLHPVSNSQPFSIRTYSAHFVTPVLFLGSLFGTFLGCQLPGQRNWRWQTQIVPKFFGIQGIRNYLMGPLTEEVVFRACVLSTYNLSGMSKASMIFLAPLTFGLAHIHHAWETYNLYGRNAAAAKRAIIQSLVQFTYTTLFGIHASYLFLRTGSLWPPLVAHIFCNVMGLPQIGYELALHRRWKWAIIATYLAGICGFVYVLPRWTLTEGNLYWPREGDNLSATAAASIGV